MGGREEGREKGGNIYKINQPYKEMWCMHSLHILIYNIDELKICCKSWCSLAYTEVWRVNYVW
jgi:hypothetical protein